MKDHTKDRNENKKEIEKIDTDVENLIDKLSVLSNESAIKRLEQRIAELEDTRKKLELKNCDTGKSLPEFETAYETLVDFIQKIDLAWIKGDLKQKKMVQYLVFPKNISYTRKTGFGTAPKSLLFELAGRNADEKTGMVEVAGIDTT